MRNPTAGIDSYSAYTSAEARSVVDSIKASGADFLKLHDERLPREVYFAVLAHARRVGIPVIGHLPKTVTLLEASDSGQRTVEHLYLPILHGHLRGTCEGEGASVAKCTAVARRLTHNGTWLVPTLVVAFGQYDSWDKMMRREDTHVDRIMAEAGPVFGPVIRLMQPAGMPILAGTDQVMSLFNDAGTGVSLPRLVHDELAYLVRFGLTPLGALQAATLNPAQSLNATDSLGTVAPGKLADLVLLDANPLADIRNTTAIRAVVANGRYFDRAALDTIFADIQRLVSEHTKKNEAKKP